MLPLTQWAGHWGSKSITTYKLLCAWELGGWACGDSIGSAEALEAPTGAQTWFYLFGAGSGIKDWTSQQLEKIQVILQSSDTILLCLSFGWTISHRPASHSDFRADYSDILYQNPWSELSTQLRHCILKLVFGQNHSHSWTGHFFVTFWKRLTEDKAAEEPVVQEHKHWLFYFWPIQLNYNDECIMPITVDIPSNKHYSSHYGRQSYPLIITYCNAMLHLWSMSNIIPLNQFNHFRTAWPQTNFICNCLVAWKTLLLTSSHKHKLNTGVNIEANKLDSAASYVDRLRHRTLICAIMSITL